MRVTTRRLLEEQMAVVVASDSGTKDDAMLHVPHMFLGLPSVTQPFSNGIRVNDQNM